MTRRCQKIRVEIAIVTTAPHAVTCRIHADMLITALRSRRPWHTFHAVDPPRSTMSLELASRSDQDAGMWLALRTGFRARGRSREASSAAPAQSAERSVPSMLGGGVMRCELSNDGAMSLSITG